jgi:iron complex transport system substrate-binding protein
MNYERLVELAPSFVFTSGGFDGGDKLNIKLHALHINSVLNLDYLEQDPLARAEWLKFIAAFFDCEDKADSLFAETENRYLALKEKAKLVESRPKVFCNLPFKEIWYMPCGENYMARMIEDAGGDFLWKETTANNGFNLNLDYEAVYNQAAHADFWINVGFTKTLDELSAMDIKNTFFKAWRTGQVYNNNRRNTPSGGFDFWESGIVNPDLILSDLITIFHPGMISGHDLHYYQQLR